MRSPSDRFAMRKSASHRLSHRSPVPRRRRPALKVQCRKEAAAFGDRPCSRGPGDVASRHATSNPAASFHVTSPHRCRIADSGSVRAEPSCAELTRSRPEGVSAARGASSLPRPAISRAGSPRRRSSRDAESHQPGGDGGDHGLYAPDPVRSRCNILLQF